MLVTPVVFWFVCRVADRMNASKNPLDVSLVYCYFFYLEMFISRRSFWRCDLLLWISTNSCILLQALFTDGNIWHSRSFVWASCSRRLSWEYYTRPFTHQSWLFLYKNLWSAPSKTLLPICQSKPTPTELLRLWTTLRSLLTVNWKRSRHF